MNGVNIQDETPCAICNDTGWRSITRGKEREVVRCECRLKSRSERLLAAAKIPPRYEHCDLSTFRCDQDDKDQHSLAKAKLYAGRFVEEYPTEKTGLLFVGSVGVGKSLFARRYKDVLQKPEDAARTRWAFIDFNTSTMGDPASAERWVFESFVEAFQAENPGLDLFSASVQRGVFSKNLQKRRSIYEELERVSPEKAATQRASDLAKWQDDPRELAFDLEEGDKVSQTASHLPEFEPKSAANRDVFVQCQIERVHRPPPTLGQGCASVRRPSKSSLA